MRKEQIAKARGCNWRTVTRWAQAGCPHTKAGKHKPYRFNLDEVEAWLAQQGRSGEPGRPAESDESDSQKEADLKWTRERARLAEIRRQTLEGALHDTAECQRHRLRQIMAVKSELLGLPRTVAPELVGKKRPEIEVILTGRVTSILEKFARDE